MMYHKRFSFLMLTVVIVFSVYPVEITNKTFEHNDVEMRNMNDDTVAATDNIVAHQKKRCLSSCTNDKALKWGIIGTALFAAIVAGGTTASYFFLRKDSNKGCLSKDMSKYYGNCLFNTDVPKDYKGAGYTLSYISDCTNSALYIKGHQPNKTDYCRKPFRTICYGNLTGLQTAIRHPKVIGFTHTQWAIEADSFWCTEAEIEGICQKIEADFKKRGIPFERVNMTDIVPFSPSYILGQSTAYIIPQDTKSPFVGEDICFPHRDVYWPRLHHCLYEINKDPSALLSSNVKETIKKEKQSVQFEFKKVKNNKNNRKYINKINERIKFFKGKGNKKR